MKVYKKILCIVCTASIILSGCGNSSAKSFGGDIKLELKPGEKLEQITWKEDSLWYLTRPMRKDEIAETHVFKQDSQWGVFEGSVTVVESKK